LAALSPFLRVGGTTLDSDQQNWQQAIDSFVTFVSVRKQEEWFKWLYVHEEPYSTDLREDLEFLTRVVTGRVERADDSEELVRVIVDMLLDLLFELQTGERIVPAAWWETSIGRLCSWAMLWADHDEAITVTDAAKLLGVGLSAVSNMVDRGALRAVIVDVANPQRGRRLLSKKEVLQIVGE
jgi:hypothetical protein